MNLPMMLRLTNPRVQEYDEQPFGIGLELAALVEAQDEYFRLNLPLHHDGDCACDFCIAANKVAAARAALVAKIGGKG